MNLKDSERVLDEISRAKLPQDLNLLPGILEQIQQGNRPTMNPTNKLRVTARHLVWRRYALALLLAVVMLIALFSLPGVASALKGLIGYIPGVGSVDQSAPLRVLANPVTDTRDGFSITVESAVLDSTRAVLDYTITGPFPAWKDPALQPRMCRDYPILRLPDGSELVYPRREGSFGGVESHWQDIFPAVPADVNKAVLVLPCLAEFQAGGGPQNWEIPLVFVPAPPEMTVFPVVEPPTPMVGETAAPVETGEAEGPAMPDETPPADGMQLTLEGAAVLDDGYYLQTIFRWEEDPTIFEVEIFPDSVHLFDANGQEAAYRMTDQLPPIVPAENLSMALNLQTAPNLPPGPVRLVIDYVGVHVFAFTGFTLDVGSDPQPGQTWEVNKELDINGYHLRVVSAEYIQPAPGEPAMLMLYLESDSGIKTINAVDKDHEIIGTGGSPGSEHVPFRAGWYYKDGFPTGIVNIEISTIVVRRSGPWSLTWTPPGLEGTSTAQPAGKPTAQAVCTDAPVPVDARDLPAELGGRVAFSEGENLELFVANLDGSSRIALGNGVLSDLSPDGSRLVYRGLDGGIYLRDLAGTDSILIPGTNGENISSISPRWSPDGQQIAFDRAADHAMDIYLVDADGSNLRPALAGPEDESLLGWAPDGRQMVYMVTVPEGMSIRVFDFQTGTSREAALLPPLLPDEGMQIKLSPDAKRLLIITNRGIFLRPLDGGEPVLLINNANNFGNPVWSPDGKWILMSYWGTEDRSKHIQALLQPDTCQMLRFEAPLADLLSSWGP